MDCGRWQGGLSCLPGLSPRRSNTLRLAGLVVGSGAFSAGMGLGTATIVLRSFTGRDATVADGGLTAMGGLALVENICLNQTES